MKLLLIYGEQDAGKSTTCRLLYNVLKGLGAIVEYYEAFPWGDFKSSLKLNGSKIAIYSAGDENHHLKSAMDFGESKGCDVIVAVVRVGTHYKETLANLSCGEDYEWFTLERGKDLNDVLVKEQQLTIRLLNDIVK